MFQYVATSTFVDDFMFSHNAPHDVWHQQYLHERHAGASSHKFTTYLPGGATLFDFVVIHNGSKLCTGAVSHDNTQGAATGWWPAVSE